MYRCDEKLDMQAGKRRDTPFFFCVLVVYPPPTPQFIKRMTGLLSFLLFSSSGSGLDCWRNISMSIRVNSATTVSPHSSSSSAFMDGQRLDGCTTTGTAASQSSCSNNAAQNKLSGRSLNNGTSGTDTLLLGTRVIVPSLCVIGVIRYLGETHFKPGLWAGIELDLEGAGKNNGSVQG